MTEVSVLVVDDHEPFRRAMAAVVEVTDGFLLVRAVAPAKQPWRRWGAWDRRWSSWT